MEVRKRIWAVLVVLAFCLGGQCPAQGRGASEPTKNTKGQVKEPSGSADVVTLDELIQAAQQRNPSIQAAEQMVEAKRARVLPETTLPDPTVSFQTMGDLIPPDLQAGDPSSGRTFSVEQEIPFPGKLGLKGQIASKAADVQSWSHEKTRRQVVADVKKAYYDYYFIEKSLQIVSEDRGLLKSFAEIAEAKYRVGQGTQQDVLKAQVEISRLIDREAVLEQREKIVKAMLNNLLYRQPEAPLGKPADFKKAELRLTIDELHNLALQASPSLKMQEQEIERSRYAVDLAKREYYPDFALGFSYVDRGSIPEMYGIMVKAKVPIYFWRKQRPALDGARAELSSAQKERDSVESTLFYNVKDAYTLATTSDRLVKLYLTALIPQSDLTLQAALASYQVGTVDFLTLVDSLVTLLEYQLKYYESLTDFQKALAQMEPFVGIELTQ